MRLKPKATSPVWLGRKLDGNPFGIPPLELAISNWEVEVLPKYGDAQMPTTIHNSILTSLVQEKGRRICSLRRPMLATVDPGAVL
ncbi:hypothetical protein GX48_04599 [Paracoccidioides brasiliensis]|nr:hypothetical protein GX48_04599 [Paracoccidioides brasiliensis]